MKSADIPDDSWAYSEEQKETAGDELCSGCGAPLTPQARGANGECLRCATSGSDKSLNDDLGSDTVKTKQSGAAIRYGHFEVLPGPDGQPEELGFGAMATTYRARDTVLQSLVALKIISGKIAGDPIARSRFLREARAAAKLRHLNVGSVFHYGEQNGECYYVMELIRGETLTERVQSKGVFTPKQALEVGVQVASALAAAESSGLVHRDIKPSNLMLETDPDSDESGADQDNQGEGERTSIKVIDWGLAKSISAEDRLFGHDQTWDGFIGTPGFASPEQFERPAENRVDTRSDIYSLGVTLWYLLCGCTPLVGDTLEAIHERQKELPWEQLKSAKVPGRLIEVLRSILAFDPVERPQSARELLDLLLRCQQRLNNVPAPAGRMQRWLSLFAIVLTGLVVTGAGLWWQRAPKHRTNGGAAKPSIAVLPFENLSPDQAQAFFSLGVHNGIRDSLATVAGLSVLSTDSTARYKAGQPRDYVAIGRTLGVKHLLEGSVRRVDQRISISIRLVEAEHSDQAWESKAEGALIEVFSLQSKLVRGLISHLQTSLSPEEDHRLDLPLTNDPVALDLYLQATNVGDTGDDLATRLQEIPLLEAAVARDPNFYQAYCELVQDHLFLYEGRQVLPPKEQGIDHRGLANIALAQARRLQPDGGKVHYATAYLMFTSNQDSDQAWIEVELAQKALPNDSEVYQCMGMIAYRQGRWREATGYLERMCALNPLAWEARWDLATVYRRLRRYTDFDRAMKLALDTMPAEIVGKYGVQWAYGAAERGDLAPLRKALTGSLPSRSAFFGGWYLHLYERDAEALAQTLAQLKGDSVRRGDFMFPRAAFAAQLDLLRADSAQAQKDFGDARDWMEKQVLANPTSGWMLSMLALFDAGLGRKEEATEEALRAVDLEPYGSQHLDRASYVRGNLALVYAWTGRKSQALDVLESVAGKPLEYESPSQPSYGDLLLNPCWDSLRGNPRFQRILERFREPVPGS
jgi:serine/threonine protein kinase/Flp pilus assembly protein TadD